MLFNSIDFVVFLPLVLLAFWVVERISYKAGNAWLLVASAFFYGWWDWRYLGLVFLSGAIDYFASIQIDGSTVPAKRKLYLVLSIITNLGILGFFKYYDFFVTSFCDAFTLLGSPIEPYTLGIILPVGISFYTFQSMSYTIDVYRGDLKASRQPVEFGAYLLFFPQLVAGPIERATHFIPQFRRRREFDLVNAIDGTRQMLWGLFKKVVIADQCAPIVERAYADPGHEWAIGLIVATVLFAVQIYCDFSGYSDIAIGCARLFGFSLMRNFAYPYFSRDIAEFWRRWHISLSTWFRDYLYIPLGGSRGSNWVRVRNTFIVFLVSGFWHGANYTFIIWGAIHALLFLPLLLSGRNRTNTSVIAADKWYPAPKELGAVLLTFTFTCFAWIFFRASDLQNAWLIIMGIFKGLFKHPGQLLEFPGYILSIPTIAFIGIMFVVEWMQRDQQHGLAHIENFLQTPYRWAAYYALIIVILFNSGEEQTFIYFQF